MIRHTRIPGLAFLLVAAAAQAADVVIEPDNFAGDVSGVAPGATLSTFRADGASGFTFHPVYSIASGGNWTPTGTRVFGHRKSQPSETIHHWDYLSGAYHCEHNNICGSNFYVFRVDFDTSTTRASVLTTVRGEMAMDPIELAAFDANGDRILRCSTQGVDQTVLSSGVLPPPRYITAAGTGPVCGKVVEIKNCPPLPSSTPGNCDYVVQLSVIRRVGDIQYVMFGGPLWQNTWAPVDKLSYWLP